MVMYVFNLSTLEAKPGGSLQGQCGPHGENLSQNQCPRTPEKLKGSQNRICTGQKCSSVVDCLPSMHKVLGSFFSSAK